MRRPCPGSGGGSCWPQCVGVALWLQPPLSYSLCHELWATVGHWGHGVTELVLVGQASAVCSAS